MPDLGPAGFDGTDVSHTMNNIILIIYLALLILAVPWYWPAEHNVIWFGMPGWVIVAIGVSFLASVLTASLMFNRGAQEQDDE